MPHGPQSIGHGADGLRAQQLPQSLAVEVATATATSFDEGLEAIGRIAVQEGHEPGKAEGRMPIRADGVDDAALVVLQQIEHRLGEIRAVRRLAEIVVAESDRRFAAESIAQRLDDLAT